MLHEFDRILEAQTLDYYARRREVLAAAGFRARCDGLARDYAADLVARWLTPGPRFDYARGFARLSEELALDFGEDAAHLHGLGPAALADALGDMLCERLDERLGGLDGETLERLLKLLYLQTSDELWGGHLDDCRQLAVSVSLAATSLRAALVECAAHCADAYRAFLRAADAKAARRILRYDAERALADADDTPPPDLANDLGAIVGR